jgi:hypothetical protein
MKRTSLLAALCAVALMTSPALGTARAATAAAASNAAPGLDVDSWEPAELGDIDPLVFATAMDAASAAVANGQAKAPDTLTVIDYTRPSTQKRMWVYDLRSHALLFDEWVAHGRGSGKTMASSFSNDPDSNMSSLGLFRTAEVYDGHNGYSLRLDGLQPGINDKARERAIVIHGAPYVNPMAARAQGYLGRSLGCPAVRPEIAHALIDAVKGGNLLFAYGGPAR